MMEVTDLHRLKTTLFIIGCEFDEDGNDIVVGNIRFQFDADGKFGGVE